MLGQRQIAAALFALLLSAAACQTAAPDSVFARMPRDVRTGAVEMAIARVESEVSQQEVALAVQAMVDRETMCFPFPGVWLDGNDRRNVFTVRYDLMTRDWGAESSETGNARMQELVDMGFLTARPRPDKGPGAVEYTLTETGAAYIRGSPYSGERTNFCAPSERRVTEIRALEAGNFQCGSLRVAFAHSADTWPSWARTENAQTRVAQAWGAPGATGEGSVSLGRLWYRHGSVPADMRENGELRSACFDEAERAVVGEDLELSPAAPSLAE